MCLSVCPETRPGGSGETQNLAVTGTDTGRSPHRQPGRGTRAGERSYVAVVVVVVVVCVCPESSLTVAARTGTGECMGRKKRVREEGSEDDAWLYGEEPLPDMSKKPRAPRNEAQPQGKRNTELPPDLRDSVKAALLGHYGHEGAVSAGPLQVLQEFVAPSRIADALFEQRCSDLEFSSSQMAEHLNTEIARD